jgi:putative ABC transport system ATP-binding protein
VTLDIPSGRFVALMGPSGSGKSTLMNLLAGLDRPDTGEVIVAGQRLSTLDEDGLATWRSRHVGLVFQFYNLLPVLSALENVELPLLLTDLARGERRRRAEIALDAVGIPHRAHHRPAELSGGEQQRAAIARALANDPPIVTADEPTGNLDSETAGAVLELFRALAGGGTTVVIATHDRDISRLATRTITLHDGRIAG